jgi:hypothetical protein
MMSRETVSNPARPTGSAGTPRVSSSGEKAGAAEQVWKGAQVQDRIAQRAYELYEQRGRQEGRALEDWVNAERQLGEASSK